MTPQSEGQLARMLETFIAAPEVTAFDVGAYDHAVDKMEDRRGWTRGVVWKARNWMARKNGMGSSIYIRPARALEVHPWILVDDLTTETVATIRTGHPPGLIVETSPRCFQAWIRMNAPHPAAVRTDIARMLRETYGADPGGVGGNQFGRVPGLTNRKPERARADGRPPFAALRHHGPAVVTVDVAKLAQSTKRAPAAATGERTGNAGNDRSAQDFAAACRLVERGRSDDEIANAIREIRAGYGDPKGQRQDYVERTIRAARRHVAQGESR